jgi:mRNA interferase MazF
MSSAAPGPGALYPPLAPGAHGLTKPSYAVVSKLRSIDKQRIRRRYGQVSEAELAAIDAGLRLYLGLVPDPD